MIIGAHSTRHKSPWSGTSATPAAVSTRQAATEGRHSSHPLASPASNAIVRVRGAIGASGCCSNSRSPIRTMRSSPQTSGSTVTVQSPARMRTFSVSEKDACKSSSSPLLHLRTSSGQQIPEVVKPRLMLRLHHHRAKHITCPSGALESLAGPNQNCGNCTSARCKLRLAHAEKID